MHDVLARLLVILEGLKLGLQLQRVEPGMISEVMMRSLYQDIPLVVIEPLGSRDAPSVIAGHRQTTYNIRFWVMHNNSNPNNSRMVDPELENQYPTLSQIEEKMREAFSQDKNLGGVVRKWGYQWDTEQLIDPDLGYQIDKISTSWIHDLIPFDGLINNQSDTIRAIA